VLKCRAKMMKTLKKDQKVKWLLIKDVPNQVWNDIRELRERREEIDNQIDTMTKKISSLKGVKKTLIDSKYNDDKKLNDIREKINQTERKKSKYLNLIDFVIAIRLDQFCKFEHGANYRTNVIQMLSQEINKSILITKKKIEELKRSTLNIIEQNKEHENEINKFNEDIGKLNNTKKELDNEEKKLNSIFAEEQILKFGIIINFENLLKAAKDVTVSRILT
jgi:septal ring factor EnvC (AmiA/AmiB activator)